MLNITQLFDLSHTLAAPLLATRRYPWEILPLIGPWIAQVGPTLPPQEYDNPSPQVWIAKSAIISPSADITGPCIICPNAQLRRGAFLRGNVLVGQGAVVGNSTELKNVILFDQVQVPHYNYVGDSILGFRAHMGAGAITSNVKSDKSLVVVKDGQRELETGLKKFGAMLGDDVEVGCNSVLNPGTILGRGCRVYPLSSVRGVVPERSIYKNPKEIVLQKE